MARQKSLQGVFEIFCGMSEFVFIYSTISCGTPDSGVRNPGWDLLI
jgi:hypothetical protein